MTSKWKIYLAAGVALCLGLLWLQLSADAAHDRFLESLYQQVQAEHRAEFDRRQANIARRKAIEKQTAAAYEEKIAGIAAATDKRVSAIQWKSNAALRQARASGDEILGEKAKVETALVEMTIGRDGLIVAAHSREKEIMDERARMKLEYVAAISAKQDELNTCEKARKEALDRTYKRTWISIGPSSNLYMKDGTVHHAIGISIQIPILEIKSPFKRF